MPNFLKSFAHKKRKLKGNEMVSVNENVYVILQRKLPQKCKDLGTFTIPCKIGDTRFEKAILDLGASINVMPYSIYDTLNLGPLKQTSIIMQLVDRSNAFPNSVIKDVLVQVNELVFSADFYVLEIRDENSPNLSSILLGRPFLKTKRTKIDVHSSILTMEFDSEIICFNIYETMKNPSDVHFVFAIDMFDLFMQKTSIVKMVWKLP
ncbi:hypothetical protein REPUB_Repub10bG0072200 [Reevesia pubescens]